MSRLCGLSVLALTVALAAEVGGQAGDQPGPKKKLPPALEKLFLLGPDAFIQRFDKNKDGMLSKDELPPYLQKPFARFDANGDGKLDRAEVAQMLKGLRTYFGIQAKGPGPKQVEAFVDKLLAQFDKDKDGKISKAEAGGQLAKNFAQLDLNKDGFLDRMELRAVARRVLAGIQKRRALAFDDYDRNADGRLTRDEVRGTPLEKVFDQIDTNRDGRISREEFEEFLEKRAAKKK